MKLFILAASVSLLGISADKCDNKKTNSGQYKAKLETKGICMNYTFTLQEGTLDTSFINASWTNEISKKTYKNAFGLVNPCDFPATINEGDEFWFVIDSTTKGKDCAVCLAYYPTPSKKLWVKVIQK